MCVEYGSSAFDEFVDILQGFSFIYDGLTVEDQRHCLLFGIITD